MDIGSTRVRAASGSGSRAELSQSGEPRGGAGRGAVAKEAERGEDSRHPPSGRRGWRSPRAGRRILREEVETPEVGEFGNDWEGGVSEAGMDTERWSRNPGELGGGWSLCISEDSASSILGYGAGWGLASP